MERILGYPPADLPGLNAFDLIHPDDRSLAEGKFRRSLETGTKFEQLEARVRHRDGSWRTLSFIGRPLPPETGMQGLIINARDLTDRQQLEAQLRVSQKMEGIGRLAGGIAHDFNNLLTAILGYSELMEAQLPDDEDLRSSLREIQHAGERAAALTRQLLAFSRRQVLQPKLLDLNEVVSEVEKLLRRLIGEDVELVTRLDPGLENIKADPGQLEQVLMNLAVNARDAMPEGGTLTIETANAVLDARFAAGHPGARSGEYTALKVADTGIGMSEEVRSHAFEPFFTTKEQGKGTGLGLATAYGIVKQSDGYITVESEPGRGTTFRIYFPRAAGAAAPSGLGERPALSPRGAETILLVEDEPGVRRLSRSILEAQGYIVLEAASGDEALGVARSYTRRDPPGHDRRRHARHERPRALGPAASAAPGRPGSSSCPATRTTPSPSTAFSSRGSRSCRSRSRLSVSPRRCGRCWTRRIARGRSGTASADTGSPRGGAARRTSTRRSASGRCPLSSSNRIRVCVIPEIDMKA